MPFNKEVTIGLDKEFADAIDEFFKEYPLYKLPGGIIEILSGAFDGVGSSNFALKKVMNMLLLVFQHIDEFDDDKLQYELLKLMWILSLEMQKFLSSRDLLTGECDMIENKDKLK